MSRLDVLAAEGVVESKVPLAGLTTYKFGGPADWFVEAPDIATVDRVISAAIADGVPHLILGRGSNLVISDYGFSGVAIRLGGELAAMTIDESGVVSCGAAFPLPKLARACAKVGRGGLEFLVAVPGSVGGAVRMNAGCHGSETGDWLLAVTVYRPGQGTLRVDRAEMRMSYRSSSLPEDDVILAAELRTVPTSPAKSEEIMRLITQWRRENQPGGTLNAGSVFKNPPGEAAGFLIDTTGLKGFAVGGARVSPRHANFFEAEAGTRAQDVFDLVWEVQRRVLAATGVELQPEIKFAGRFDAPRERSQEAQPGPVTTTQDVSKGEES